MWSCLHQHMVSSGAVSMRRISTTKPNLLKKYVIDMNRLKLPIHCQLQCQLTTPMIWRLTQTEIKCCSQLLCFILLQWRYFYPIFIMSCMLFLNQRKKETKQAIAVQNCAPAEHVPLIVQMTRIEICDKCLAYCPFLASTACGYVLAYGTGLVVGSQV